MPADPPALAPTTISAFRTPILTMLLALLPVTALVACTRSEAVPATAPPPAEIRAARVVQAPAQEWGEFNGRITAIQSVEIRPRVGGYVQRVAFQEGEEVRAGQLLFTIDPRPFQDAVNNAAAQRTRAQAALGLAEAQARRARQLIAARAVSTEEAETRAADEARARADLSAADATLATARLNLGFTEIRAPVAGRTSRALMTIGNLAQADQSVLTTLVSQDPVFVYFDCDEQTYLQALAARRAGQGGSAEVRIAHAGEQGFPHVGRVDFVDNQVNPATGTIRARAVLDNGSRTFTPGLFARVQWATRAATESLLVDDKAILTDQDRKYVYVIGPENRALRKDVVPGPMADGLRVVRSGLAPGDRVVVGGVQRVLFPGAPVNATEVPMRATAASAPAVAAR